MHGVNFEALFNSSPNAYVLMNRQFVIIGANEAYLRVTGKMRQEIVGLPMVEAFAGDPRELQDQNVVLLRESLQRALDRRCPDQLPIIKYGITRSTDAGPVFEERFWSATHTPLFGADGEVQYILQHTEDITEFHSLRRSLAGADDTAREQNDQLEARILRRAWAVQEENQVLLAEANHLRRLFGQAPGFMCFLRGPSHVFEIANAAYFQLIGRTDVIGHSVRSALPEVDGQGFFELLDQAYASGEPFVGRDLPVRLRRGQGDELATVYVDVVYQPVAQADGVISGIFVQGNDVTERHLALEELRRHRDDLERLVAERTRELEASEAERRQALKMEAVGKLTGGIAHDFNNVLQVIGGNMQLLRRMLPPDERALSRLNAAMSGVDRGAKLASQLLSFARKQPLEPVVLNAGALLRSMDDILRRALGEAIEVETVISGGVWNIHVDRNQLENALLNLAINSRDAMEGSGRITLESYNASLDDNYALHHNEVTPGQYVVIAVSDTGAGMSEDTAAKAFDPFFTTKGDGHGSGLGLSMVYGFVKQSGGHVKIYTEMDHGTTVKMYLPRSHAVEQSVTPIVDGTVVGGNETVLVVEDDAAVRATAVDLLSELGYHVLKASDAQSALAVVQSGVPIDLLFTDVVMPGPIRSPELARRAKAMQPRMEVLFTSGYTENAIVHGGRLDPGVALLSKPYRRNDLARKIRQILADREQADRPNGALPEDSRSSTDARLARQRLRVLVVEDETQSVTPTTDLILFLGHAVTSADTAETALKLIDGYPFDVLLTDIEPVGMTGPELARLARRKQSLGVVFASNSAPFDTGVAKARWLQKPYTLENMAELLNGFLRDAGA
jgi:signal transduction histidine kinase/DNA-binding response OmpR family regulator